MKKIIVIGSGGAGKSTLAIKLGKVLNLKVYHLDAMLWKSSWVKMSKEEQIKIQNELVKQDKWIIDGNWSGTMDIRLSACDTIIFLDILRLICLFRVIKRFFMYRKKTRPDMVEENKEKIDFKFLKWVWNYPKVQKPIILNKIKEVESEKRVIIIKNNRDIKKLMNNVII